MELFVPALVVLPTFGLWLLAARSANPKGRQIGAWFVGIILAAIAILTYPLGYWHGGLNVTAKCSSASIEFHEVLRAALDEGKVDEVREVLASLDLGTWTYEYPLFIEQLELASAKLQSEE
jgi:uncharacterized membrane protein YfbV (UPF0208 family)